MQHRMLPFVGVLVVLSGCTITQNVNPTSVPRGGEICVVENPAVREGVLPVIQHALTNNGYRYRMLPQSASPSDCPVSMTYVARWSWDLTIYMSYCRLQAFVDGQPAGDALYDATRGGGNLGKFIDAEPKVQELVEQLFPRRTTDEIRELAPKKE